MTLNELRTRVSGKAGLSKMEAAKAVDCLLDAILNGLSDGEKVSVMGFGTFEKATRAGWVGRNPRSGEPVEIKEVYTVRFRPGKDLKAAIKR